MSQIVGWMVIIQSGLLLFGLFINPLSLSYYRWYINFMPEFKHYSVLTAEFVFPIIIFIFCLWGMLTLPKEEGGDRLYNGAPYLFVMINQFAIMVWFYTDIYKGGLKDLLEVWKDERKVILIILDSLKNLP